MTDKIWLKHTLTGVSAKYPAHYANHPSLGKHLVPSGPEGCTDCTVSVEEDGDDAVIEETVVDEPSVEELDYAYHTEGVTYGD